MKKANMKGLLIGVIALMIGLYLTKAIWTDIKTPASPGAKWEILMITLLVGGLFILKSLKGHSIKSILNTKVDRAFPTYPKWFLKTCLIISALLFCFLIVLGFLRLIFDPYGV